MSESIAFGEGEAEIRTNLSIGFLRDVEFCLHVNQLIHCQVKTHIKGVVKTGGVTRDEVEPDAGEDVHGVQVGQCLVNL